MSETPNGNGRLLARIDERTKAIKEDIGQLHEDFAAYKTFVRETYVTNDKFQPIQKFFYAATVAAVVSFVGAVMAWVLR